MENGKKVKELDGLEEMKTNENNKILKNLSQLFDK